MPRKKHKFSPKDLAAIQPKVLPFEGEWKAFMGEPEDCGTWIIWGQSFNGKTRFTLRLAKYLAELGKKVAIVSLEEGNGVSIRKAFAEQCMMSVNQRVSLWVEMDVEEIKRELRKQRAPRVVIVDSLQYLGINYQGYKRLKEEFSDRLLIFISQASSTGEPRGSTAEQVRYDAMVKIQVSQFRAKAHSRYGGGEVMTIWDEGAARATAQEEFDNQ